VFLLFQLTSPLLLLVLVVVVVVVVVAAVARCHLVLLLLVFQYGWMATVTGLETSVTRVIDCTELPDSIETWLIRAFSCRRC